MVTLVVTALHTQDSCWPPGDCHPGLVQCTQSWGTGHTGGVLGVGLQHTAESVAGWEGLGLVGWCSPRLPLSAPSGPRTGGSNGIQLLPAPELDPPRPVCARPP